MPGPRRRWRARGASGITTVELVVSMMIFSLVGTLAVTGLSSSTRSVGQVDDEVQGLQDLRVVGERLSRDLRQARGINDTSNEHQVTIWIDANSDYRQTADETITWRLVRPAPTANQFDIVRVDGNGKKQIVGHSLVSDIAFTYDPAPPNTRVVTVEMTYDALPGRYAKLRTTTFESRLRNVP